MFGKHFQQALNKALGRKAHFPHLHPPQQASQQGGGTGPGSKAAHLHQTHRLVASATGFGAATPVGRIATAGFGFGCAGAAVLGAATTMMGGQQQAEPLPGGALEAPSGTTDDYGPSSGSTFDVMEMPWVQGIVAQQGVREVLSPGQMLRQNPIAKFLVDQDHLFETMMQTRQIHDFRCFYDTKAEQFHSVVVLGRDVCGFPQTVHGGLTAAIMDETFGGLCVSLWRQGRLGLQPPGYTARLEVDYKQKIPAGSVVVCSTSLESVDQRKVWMRATMSDGAGTTYAVARALFVSPKLLPGNVGNVLTSWIPGRGKREQQQEPKEPKGKQ